MFFGVLHCGAKAKLSTLLQQWASNSKAGKISGWSLTQRVSTCDTHGERGVKKCYASQWMLVARSTPEDIIAWNGGHTSTTHLSHQPMCANPRHLRFEEMMKNQDRNVCRTLAVTDEPEDTSWTSSATSMTHHATYSWQHLVYRR
jgi:hypothetical protein